MRLLRGDVFPVSKGLHVLIEVRAIHFSMSSFRGFELQNRIRTTAVDAADEELL